MDEKVIICCGAGLWLKIISILRIIEYLVSTATFSFNFKNIVEHIKDFGHGQKREPDYALMFGSLAIAYLALNLVYSFVLLIGSTHKITGLLKAWMIWCVVGLIFATSLIIIRFTCLDSTYITSIIIDMFLDLFVLWITYRRLNEILAVRLRSDLLLNNLSDN